VTTIPEEYELLFDAATVEHAVDQIAVRIALELTDALPVFVCIMNGGLPFMWDLTKRLNFPLAMDFLYATRYGGMEGGEVQIHTRPRTNLRDRNVVLVDDVIDHGVTMQAIVNEFKGDAAAVWTAVLAASVPVATPVLPAVVIPCMLPFVVEVIAARFFLP